MSEFITHMRASARFITVLCTVLAIAAMLCTGVRAQTCSTNLCTIPMSSTIYLDNNQWGNCGCGTQSITVNTPSSFSTTWNYGGPVDYKIRSYAAAILGWQYGWLDSGTGFPIALSAHTPVYTSSTYSVSGGSQWLDVSYDLWFHPTSTIGNSTPQSAEMMIWMANYGALSQSGTPKNVTIDGINWDVYNYPPGSWMLNQWVPHGLSTWDLRGANLNMTDFTDYLVSVGWMDSSWWMSSVQFGTEIYNWGAGTLNVAEYSAKVGAATAAPPAPTSLVASGGNMSATLAWTAAPGATSYNVRRSTVSGSGYVTTATGITRIDYTDTGLTNGTTYYYVMTATNPAGTSPNSNESSTTAIIPPVFTSSATASPTAIQQGGSTAITATVTDTANTLTNGIIAIYVVDPNNTQVATQQWTAQNFTLNQQRQYTLTYNSLATALSGTYTVHVAVYSSTYQVWNWNNSAVTFGVNANIAFTASASASPSTVAAPNSTTVTGSFTETGPSGLTNGVIDIEVQDSTGAKVGQGTWTGVNFTANQNKQFSFSWPASTTAGTYTIKTGVFNSDWSVNYNWNNAAGTITDTGWSGPPLAPTGLAAVSGNGEVGLTWTAGTGATAYNVLRSTVNGSGYASVATGIAPANYMNVGLANGTTYYFVVQSVNASGTSGNSNQASAAPVSTAATAISIDFVGGGTNNGNPASMGAAETAGVVPVFNWNNATGISGSGLALNYNTGPGSGATAAWSCNNTFSIPITESNGNYRMMKGYLDDGTAGSSTVTVSSIPSALTSTGYDVYVYFDGDNGTGAVTSNYTIGGTTIIGTDAASTNFAGTFTQANNSNGNYVKFSNLNTASFTMTASPGSGSNRAPTNGIQIVQHASGGIPPAPSGLTATPGNAQVSLSWTASSGATSYNALRSTVNGSGYASVATGISTTSYTHTGLTNGTTYYFVVTATNASGTSGNSNQASATPAAGAPPPPTNLVATVNGTTIQLTWTNSPGAAWYNIWRGTTSGGETLYGTGQVNQPFSDNGLANGTYYYKLVAVNSGGQTSGFSNEASATVGSGGIPPAPTGLIATPGNAQVTLSWTASSGATAYDVKRSTVNGSGYVTVSSPTATNYTNTGLTNGTTYYFVVDAKNASGTSGNSAQASATPTAGSPPAAPTGLAATAGTAQALLYWTGSTGATSYNISRSTVSGSGYASIATGVTVTTYTNTGLTNGTTYYYVVSATNANDTSANSAQSSATPAAGAPANPTALTATKNGTTVQLTFTVPTGQSWYNIYRGTAAGCEVFIGGGQVNQPFSDNGLAGGTYYYKVVSFNSAGIASGYSNEASATIP